MSSIGRRELGPFRGNLVYGELLSTIHGLPSAPHRRAGQTTPKGLETDGQRTGNVVPSRRYLRFDLPSESRLQADRGGLGLKNLGQRRRPGDRNGLWPQTGADATNRDRAWDGQTRTWTGRNAAKRHEHEK